MHHLYDSKGSGSVIAMHDTSTHIARCLVVVLIIINNILFAHDPLSSSGYPMIIYTHPVAGNLPIKALVARQ